jgi:chemotaxis protein MotB
VRANKTVEVTVEVETAKTRKERASISMATHTALCIALLLAGSFGCVTKGSYEELEAERDQLIRDREVLELKSAVLAEEVDTLASSRLALAEELEVRDVQVAELRGTYDQLVGELESEVASGQVEVQQLLDGIRLNVSDELLFASGSASLNAKGRELIERVAAKIAEEKAIISVEGHTDDVGISKALQARYPTNWELAGARAANVVRVLAESGVDATSLRAVSRGPFAPLVANDSAEGRAKNRRTEIILRPIPRSE